jgi:hypothetical protein
LNDGIYKIGPVSRTVTWFIGLLSQNTAKVSVKYMFVRCAGLDKVRFLSPKELVDLILMERARKALQRAVLESAGASRQMASLRRFDQALASVT